MEDVLLLNVNWSSLRSPRRLCSPKNLHNLCWGNRHDNHRATPVETLGPGSDLWPHLCNRLAQRTRRYPASNPPIHRTHSGNPTSHAVKPNKYRYLQSKVLPPPTPALSLTALEGRAMLTSPMRGAERITGSRVSTDSFRCNGCLPRHGHGSRVAMSPQ